MHSFLDWVTRCWLQFETVWFAICNDISLWMLAIFHHSDNLATLRSIPGNVLNEWLLIKNTSVDIDWNEPYYTSDEGLTCNLFMCNLPSCRFHSSINGKSTKSTTFYVKRSFINPSLGDVQQVFLGLSCCVYVFPINRLLNLQVVNFTAQCRSIRNNPNGPARQGVLINSRREVECREAAHKKCQVMKFLGSGPQNFGKKTWNFNTSLESEPSEKTYRDVRKVYQFRKTESFNMFSTEKLKSPEWGAWASKCCWILLSGNGEAGQYHARVTCTELLDV